MFHRRSFLVSTLAALCSARMSRDALAAGDPVQILTDAGLRRQADGVWLLPAEKRLRNRLARLPELRDSIEVLQRDLGERVRQNGRAYEAVKPVIASLEKSLSRLASNAPQRPSLERQLAAERSKATPPEEFGGQTDVRRMIVTLSQQRISLTLALLAARQTIPDLIAAYADLASSNAMAEALAELGRGNRLGPQRPLDAELRKLAELDPVVFTAHVPVWLQSGKVRLTTIIAERQPLTLTWNSYPGHGLVLTAGAAQALNIRPTAGGEARSLTFTGGRKVSAQRAMIETLRLARWRLQQVSAWILAPEGEDLGSQTDESAFSGYIARCEPASLRLTLQPREQPAKSRPAGP